MSASRKSSTTGKKEPKDKSIGSRSSSRNKEGKEQKKEVWTCKLCKAEFDEDKAELLECEICSGHMCRICLNLSADEYKFVGKRTDMHWYCPPCEEKAVKNAKIGKEIEERCRDYFQKYESRIKALEVAVAKKPDEARVQALEEAMEKKPNTDEVKAMIQEFGKSDEAKGGNSNPKPALDDMNEKLEDYKESISRRSNVIIFNAKEPDQADGEQRKAKDYELVNQVCETTKTNPETIKTITRLGKRIEEKTRPLRIIFESEAAKNKMMKNLSELKGANEELQKLSITHDLTKKERQISKEKWQEAKDKTKALAGSGDEKNFKYIPKGPPWSCMRVVRVKKK